MVSLAYGFTIGMIGLAMIALLYTIYDQILEGDLWNMAVEWQLNGTYLNIFRSLHRAVPFVVVFSLFLGLGTTAHFTKNE